MLSKFAYIAPTTGAELFDLLQEHAGNAHILAGGTDLLVDYRGGKPMPELLVDIKGIQEFRKISFSPQHGLSLGALATCAEIAEHRTVRARYPLLECAASHIGSPQLRNRATVGGNLCTGSPCADFAAALLALDAEAELASGAGTRIVPLRDFFTGVKTTRIANNEVLQRIVIPPDTAGAAWGFEKLKRIKGHDLALVSVAIARTDSALRVAVGSCAPTPVVLRKLSPTAGVKQICAEALRVLKPITDQRASKEYRLFMVQEYIRRIIDQIGVSGGYDEKK